MNIVCVPVPVMPDGAPSEIPAFSRTLVGTDFFERANPANLANLVAYAALPSEGAVRLLHIADLECIGSHGRTGMMAAMMGSIAHALIARSSRPVLVVCPPPMRTLRPAPTRSRSPMA